MKKESKIIEIPQGATIAQIQSGLDSNLNDGWKLITVFELSNKTYATFVRTIGTLR